LFEVSTLTERAPETLMQQTQFLLLAAALAFVGVACGRPATEAECEEIVERTARLRIQETQPGRAETVEREVEDLKAKANVRERIEGCVGKPITKRAMKCVREAKSSEAVQECFR
jgi:hypothetical protein